MFQERHWLPPDREDEDVFHKARGYCICITGTGVASRTFELLS